MPRKALPTPRSFRFTIASTTQHPTGLAEPAVTPSPGGADASPNLTSHLPSASKLFIRGLWRRMDLFTRGLFVFCVVLIGSARTICADVVRPCGNYYSVTPPDTLYTDVAHSSNGTRGACETPRRMPRLECFKPCVPLCFRRLGFRKRRFGWRIAALNPRILVPKS